MSSDFSIYIHASHTRERVKKETSIPVSVGLARTKTLAKIANKIARKSASGVFELIDNKFIDDVLKRTDVGDIWGICRQHTKKLKLTGVYTAYDFKNVHPKKVRKEMSHRSPFSREPSYA
jgi:DNA polymerase V